MNNLMSNIFLPCVKVTELIERRNFEKLSFIENTQLELHKKMCEPCRSYEKESLLIDDFFKKKGAKSFDGVNQDSEKGNLKAKIISNNLSK